MIAEWKPIKTAPKDGTKIMVCEGSNIEPAVWEKYLSSVYVSKPVKDRYGEKSNYKAVGGWLANGLASDEGSREIYPTHWDYLPELPDRFTQHK